MAYSPPYGGMRSARWLRSFRYGPMVTAFRNLESGQVLFTQTLHPQQYYIDKQFKFHNWQNKKPIVRKDIWRPVAVAEVPTHEDAVQLYQNLVELRNMRDNTHKQQARDWRKKSKEGNIWYWNQYRPTYTQEAVADIISALDAAGVSARLHWDSAFRRGAEEAWKSIEAEHLELPRHNPREQFVILNELRMESLKRAKERRAEVTREQQAAASEARAQGVPTAKDLKAAQQQVIRDRAARVKAGREKQRAELLKSRPDLQQLEELHNVVTRAEADLAQAKANYDHFLPHGQRGKAKEPIKLRARGLRQAKRQYRSLKHRIAARNNKRRVEQPRVRLQRK